MIAAVTAIILPPIPIIATGACVFILGQAIATIPLGRSQQIQEKTISDPDSDPEANEATPSSIPSTFRYYRDLEIRRVVAALKANSPILVVGEEGSGKSVVGAVVAEQLSEEGFSIAMAEPTTPKQMLIEIAEQLNIDT